MPSLLKMMAEMGLNITPFQKGLEQAKSTAAAQGNNIGQAFAGTINRYFGVAALTAFGASIVRRIGEIKDLADQFNLTTDEVQKFGLAFENSGLQAADAGLAIDRLNRARKEAVESSQDLRDAFASFGIGLDQLNDASVKTKDIFRQIGIALREGQVGDRERAALMELMGKNGARFVDAMKQLETVRPTLIEEDTIKRIDEAQKTLRNVRRELEAIIALQASDLFKGDIGGALFKDNPIFNMDAMKRSIETLRDFIGGGGLFGGRGLRGPQAGAEGPLPPRDFAAIKELPGEREALAKANEDAAKKKLFEDGIAAKQRLVTGKAQSEVEEKLSEIVFGKLNREQQVALLRKKQQDIDLEIAHQKRQQVNELYTEEVRQENIANLKKEQLEAEQKILALQRQGQIGFSGFRELAQTGGFNPANYAPLPQRGRPKEPGLDKTIGILGEIENQLKNKKVILGR